jgi:DNA polymerase delta subunit 3
MHSHRELIEERFRMLYEFHRKQNDKKPGSIHATYIITGTKIPTSAQNLQREDVDGDSVMQSSPPLPFPSSSAAIPEKTETIAIHTMMLVKEEQLEHVKSLFSTISCIHVYALAAKGLSQVQTLAECNRKVAVAQAGEDPLTARKVYGTIQNSSARRRTTRGPPAPIAAPAVKPAVKAAPAPNLPTGKPVSKETPIAASVQKTATDLSKAETTKTSKPAPSKASASSIFKSFAKTAPVTKNPPPALSKNDSQASATSVQDTNMTGFSDDDDADDASLPEELFATKDSQGEIGGKSKKDREAELQAMMEQDDEDDADNGKGKADGNTADDDAEMDDVDSAPTKKNADAVQAEAQEEEEPKVVVSNGRRRGKRRVPKKRTVRDEEGYLGKSNLLIFGSRPPQC